MAKKDPSQDRKQTGRGFGDFRDRLVSENRLEPIWRPSRGPGKVPERKPSDRPNVLWLMADQLRGDTFGFMDHPVCKTPNLDRLADRGAVFTRSYCSEPVCAPSRATMLTGHYNFRNGVIQNGYPMREEEVTFPQRLTDAGYRTASIGKTHCGRSSKQIFEWTQGVKDAFGATKPSDVPFKPELFPDSSYLGGEPVDNSDWMISGKYPGPVETTKSYNLATQAMKWLYWHDDPRPFFLRVSFDDPHPPVAPPEPFASMYSPEDVPEELIAGQRESMAGKPRTVQDWWTYRYMDEISEEEHRKHAARYWGLVSHLDAQMGRIMDYLEELGMAENTIVIVNSDHGQMTGEHGLVHKGPYMYEGITHIPTLLSWPGCIEPGTRVDRFAEAVDLAPTVLDMLGADVPEDMHGRSWMHLLDGDADDWREAAFMQWEDYVFCVRTDRWKLTWYEPDQDGELYDIQNDPGETANLFGADECEDVRNELIDRLNRWRSEYARPRDLPTGD